MTKATMLCYLLPLCLFTKVFVVFGTTDPQDAAALRSLLANWDNAPPGWGDSDDPCGTPWEGVMCANSRVITIGLSSMGIKGTLSGDIGLLSALHTLDLSYNKGLGGSLPSNFGNLKQLTTLILLGCSFSGSIPSELGNLPSLTFIDLNSNKLTGKIPASLGSLSKLYWLDIADNQFSGPLPVSSGTTPGLDMLLNAKHFHFNKNKLSGTIPDKLFSSDMTLLHILFDSNQFSGTIPESIGHIKTLEALRLDRNQFTGLIPSSFNNLSRVNGMILANNQLNGTLPDLSGMKSLSYLDLSNNSFDVSETPAWFAELPSLNTMAIEHGGIKGELPSTFLSISQLEQVLLRNNSFSGTLDMSSDISPQLQLVDLRDNNISYIKAGGAIDIALMLSGNPICDNPTPGVRYCLLQQEMEAAYSTNLSQCGAKSCSQGQGVNPSNCACAQPYTGLMVFRAPTFLDLSSNIKFQSLEKSLWTGLGLFPGSVSLQNILFDEHNYLDVQVSLFPSQGMYLNRSEIRRLGFYLSNHTYNAPPEFGPYYFKADPYTFLGGSGSSAIMSSAAIIGISVSCVILLIGLVILGVYAFQQKRKAKRAELSTPFASWIPSDGGDSSAPQLKGARWFSFDDLKKCTRNFCNENEIGSGGYGKVYKGTLPNGKLVAIKRARQESVQGASQFKTEIELLSRLHHKNLVGLVGFCYEKGEEMLVYEFVPNGTLRESLSGTSGIWLDWKKRLSIALGSARGIAYLHELADPPIIHRDVKSSNILLDETLTAKVADFGLSKLISDMSKGHVSTQVKGTMGYLDPEYYTTQQLTYKSDVYSFGVVMLELITSKKVFNMGMYIVREVRIKLNKNDPEFRGLRMVMDPCFRNMPDQIGFRIFVDLAMQCVEDRGVDRPTMNEVVKRIDAILQNYDSNPASSSLFSEELRKSEGSSDYLYKDQRLRKDISSDTFDSSSGYKYQSKVEPK